MEIRYIEKEDLEQVAHNEAVANYPYLDPDFDVMAVAHWAWTKGDFLSAIRQRRNYREGTYDTRTLVVETERDGEMKVVGAMVFELQEEGYEIVKFSVLPEFPDAQRELIKHITRRAQRSDIRNRITIHLRDGDWESIKFFQNQGWDVKLRPDYFEKEDGWRCEYIASSLGRGRDLAAY